MKKNKFTIITIAILSILVLVLFFQNKSLENDCIEYSREIDSLFMMQYVREDEQCLYFGKEEKEVVEKLPDPIYCHDVLLYNDSTDLDRLHVLYYPYIKRIKNGDSIHLHTYKWINPFSNRNMYYISFEKIGDKWIATTCLEYDSIFVQF
ncbi:MAG: hypothetical protein IKY79_08925 [Bacteroidales bacterium]|nr:hypothetical protein [Bacteroidales bacterium]